MTTVKNIILRITLFYLLTVILSILIAGRIIYLQFFTEQKHEAEKYELRKETIRANRGSIFTHDMQLLAVSIPAYEIHIDFNTLNNNFLNNTVTKLNFYYKKIKLSRQNIKKITKNQRKADIAEADKLIKSEIKQLAHYLSVLLKDKSAADYENFIKTNCKNNSGTIRISKKHIDYNQLQQLKDSTILGLGQFTCGLKVIDKTDRKSAHNFAAATVGTVNSNNIAVEGIEAAFDSYLRGKQGVQITMLASAKDYIPISSEDNVASQSGYDIVTTLDAYIQETAETALRQQIEKGNEAGIQVEGGTAIVMETKSGEIRAIANIKRDKNGNYGELYNYALKETSPPGSTFKLASLIALLEDGHVELSDTSHTSSKWNYVNKNGKILHSFSEYDGHNYGTISVKQVFAKSSNIGFAKLAVKYYEKNPQNFFDRLFKMGLFSKSLNLQIPGESKPYATLPDNKNWQPQLLPLSAIGYQLVLAPIHTLTFYNAIANNGKMMKPKFVKEIRHHGQVIQTFPDEIINEKICSTETLMEVHKALQGVVDSGTANILGKLKFSTAGKTGTAQRVILNEKTGRGVMAINGQHSYQASFAGYIPADNPKYTIVVVMYSPLINRNFSGATHAVPVFKTIAEKLYATDINWNNPVERNNDSLHFPVTKNTEMQKLNIIASKLGLPVDCNAANDEWISTVNKNSKFTAEKIQIDENKVPSVINMGLQDATYLLEKLGLKVTVSGKGRVKSQSINASASIVKGETILLELAI